MRRISKCLMATLAVAALAACAGQGGPHRGGGPGFQPEGEMGAGPEGGFGGHAMLFVSPMGEPFRVGSARDSALDLWFNAADADHDGAITEDEFRADALNYFARLDANHDGALTSIESTAIYQREAPEMLVAFDSFAGGPLGPRQVGDGHGGGHRRNSGERGPAGAPPGGGRAGPGHGGPMLQGAQRYGLLGEIEPVMSCDADLSRRVTPAEWDVCIAARFAALDEDHDHLFKRSEARLWRERQGEHQDTR